MPRVRSKNLFNFQPKGCLDDDIKEMDAKQKKMMASEGAAEMMAKLGELSLKEGDDSDKEFADVLRSSTDGIIGQMAKHPVLVKAGEDTIATELKVPTDHDGKYDVLVHVYTPKTLKDNTGNAAIIYAHGGGAVACPAALFKPWLDMQATMCDVVVFNVDYRLAPETKCPNNVKDFYMAIKYVIENAEKLGIDAKKIAIAGDSGGGYICLGAEVMLAQNDETNLVKLALPGIPMVDDYLFSDPAAMTNEERESAMVMRKVWKCIAADLEKQKEDPLLFPGKASTELLEKFPPTIIVEGEFDMFITEATRMAYKLRAAGRLLEFIVIPGTKHGSAMNPEMECFKLYGETLKSALQEYLHN